MPNKQSLYTKLNHLYKTEPLPLNKQALINSKEVERSEGQMNQLESTALAVLKTFRYLKTVERREAGQAVQKFATRALKLMKDRSTIYRYQLTVITNKTKFKIHRILVTLRLTDVMHLVNRSVQNAVLIKKDKASVISEIKTGFRISKRHILKAPDASSFRATFTTGVNAMSGLLMSYIAKSQAYVLHQISTAVDRINKNNDRIGNFSVLIQYQINHETAEIQSDAQSDIMLTNSFNGLKRVRDRYIQALQKISRNQHQILKVLTDFVKFSQRIAKKVDNLSNFSADARYRLESRIERHRKNVIQDLRQSKRHLTADTIQQKKVALMKAVISSVADSYQHQINQPNLNLNEAQVQNLRNEIQNDAKRGLKSLSVAPVPERKFSSLLSRLNQVISVKKRHLIDLNRIHQMISEFQEKINQIYRLSSADKKRLNYQIQIYGDQILKSDQHRSITQVRNYLRKLLMNQIKYITKSTVRRRFMDLYQQIKFSHLRMESKRKLLRRLNHLKAHQKHLSSYSDERHLIQDLRGHAVLEDKSENLKRLIKLNDRIKEDHLSILKEAPNDHDFKKFSQKVNAITNISDVDHLEHHYENRFYERLYRSGIGMDPLKKKAVQLSLHQLDEVRRKVNLFVLSVRNRQVINDRIEKGFNQHLYLILKARDVHIIKQQLIQIIRGIHRVLTSSLNHIKQEYLDDSDGLEKAVYHQVLAYLPSRPVLSKIEGLGLKVRTKLDRADDNLLQLETANQRGRQQLNAYASRIINKADTRKAAANHKINLMTKAIFKQLGQSIPELSSAEVTRASRNRMLKIANESHYDINRSSGDLAYKYDKTCRKSLNHALKQNGLQEWLRITEQARFKIHNLSHISLDQRTDALRGIQNVATGTAELIKRNKQTALPRILRRDADEIKRMVRHYAYLDPVKNRARHKLHRRMEQVRRHVKKYATDKDAKKIGRRLRTLSQDVDNKLVKVNDKDFKTIYSRNYKQMRIMELKVVQKAEFNRFLKKAKRFHQQIHKLPLLGNREFQQINQKFEITYHKAIHQIKHSSDLNDCLANERSGEEVLDKLLADNQKLNERKRGSYLRIKSEVKKARKQIVSLPSLRDKDKKASYQLLNRIEKQVRSNLKNSIGAQNDAKILNKGRSMVKQVIDKVSSAGVLVSAIKTANDQIANSRLGDQQKKATLHQINQIINEGIKNQFSHSTLNLNQNSSAKDKSKRKSDPGNQPLPNSKQTNKNKEPRKKKRKKHRGFFRSLLGK